MKGGDVSENPRLKCNEVKYEAVQGRGEDRKGLKDLGVWSGRQIKHE